MDNRRLFERIAAGQVHNVRFADFVRLVEAYGFQFIRRRGSHLLFQHPGIPDTFNLQQERGRAKPYQVRQMLRLIEEHKLEAHDV